MGLAPDNLLVQPLCPSSVGSSIPADAAGGRVGSFVSGVQVEGLASGKPLV